MANLGQTILGSVYSPNCETLRTNCPVALVPQIGDLIFFADANKPASNHVGLIYNVDSSTIYTIEGNTSEAPGLVIDGNCVATKTYSKVSGRILSYCRPKYTELNPSSKVIDVAVQEVGYLAKSSDKSLNSKTANAGSSNFTKYGKWIGANGAIWSGSFICWCFSAAYDSSFKGVIGNDPSETAINDEESTVFISQSSANSSLASYINRLTTVQVNPRPGRVECITIHTSKKIGDIYDLAVMLNSSEKSYNYGIDNSGTIGLFADESMWTNSTGSDTNDKRSINIICMNQLLEPGYRITDECYAALVNLCEDICRRNFIVSLRYTNNPTTDSITFHQQFDKKSNCPGPYVADNAVPRLIEEVNNRLLKTRLASSQTEALKAQSTVAVKSIRPYVIQPNAAILNLDYTHLKQLGVVGTMLDAGERYNMQHKQVEYQTENIYKQTVEALSGGVPHGYIYTTHARNAAEVKEEAYWFYFIVSKYPPKLGVWLHCKFDITTNTAPILVDEWYQYFIKWGLKSKCGIYATKLQATLIGWPKQCAYMPLWLEGELTDSVCPDEELLTPSFFKLDDLTNKSGDFSSIMVETEESNLGSQGVSIMASQIGQLLENIRGNYLNPEENKAEKEQTETYTNVYVPNEPRYIGVKSWKSDASITKQDNKWSYTLIHNDDTVTDNDGLLKVQSDQRYLVAVGSGISTTVGTYFDMTLQNGTVIPCVVGYVQPNNILDPVNHMFETTDTTYSCGQFIVRNKSSVLNPDIRRTGDCSYKDSSWQSPIKSFKVSTKNWFKSI